MASDAPASSPFLVYESWFKEAEESSASLSWALKPQFASLSTCSKEGQPSSRVVGAVLNAERGGFIVCGHVASRKAKELSVNPNACLLFYWSVPVVRQVRVEGKVELLSEKETIEQFTACPRVLQLHLAVQYEIAQMDFKGGKAELSKLRKELAEKYTDKSVPIPVPQGRIGYLLVPTRFEFNEGAVLDVDEFEYTRTSTETDWTYKLLV